MQEGRTDRLEEVNEMTKYYISIARYFLSTGVLTAFAGELFMRAHN